MKRGYRMIYMGPKGSFEPGCSDSKLKVEPIKPTNNRGADGSPQELTPLGLRGCLITAQQGILGGSVVGCPLNGRGEAWPMEGHYRVPSLFSKRSNQALRPGPLP